MVMSEQRKFSYLTKDLSVKPPSQPIEGRNLFDLKKKSFADSYDYKIEVVYPSTHARIDFKKIVPSKGLGLQLPTRTTDFAPSPKAPVPAGTNAIIGFEQRGGREDNLMYKLGELNKNIERDNNKKAKTPRSKNRNKSCFEYDFARDFFDMKQEILGRL